MIVRQVSSILLSPTEKLRVQLSVGLTGTKGNPLYCNIYNSGDNSYLNISPLIQLVIKYYDLDRPWSRSNSVYITQRTIFALRTELKIFYDMIMSKAEDIYEYDSFGVSSVDNTGKYVKIIKIGTNQTILIEPIIIYNESSTLPGVAMELNYSDNRVELSIDEFESFYDLVQTIQIHQEGMLLLQMYMTICKNGGMQIPVETETGTKLPTKNDFKVNYFEMAEKKREDVEDVVARHNETMTRSGALPPPTTLDEMEARI